MTEPMFAVDDVVTFSIIDVQGDKLDLVGTVAIVDAYGTFLNPGVISYDIYVEEKNTLYKHIPEKGVKLFRKNEIKNEVSPLSRESYEVNSNRLMEYLDKRNISEKEMRKARKILQHYLENEAK